MIGFFQRHPLLAGSLAAILGVVASGFPLGWQVGVALVLVVGGRWVGSGRVAWLLGSCLLVAMGSQTWRQSGMVRDHAVLLAEPGLMRQVVARVVEDPRETASGWTGLVVLETEGLPRTRVWWVGLGEVPVCGSWVRGRGRFVEPQSPRNPGAFDEVAWLRQRGAVAVFQVTERRAEVSTGDGARLAAGWKRSFREAVTDGLEPDGEAAEVIRAVVIGEYPREGDDLVAAFRRSGTLHVFSVSGLHVAMVGSIGWWLLRRMGVSRRVAVLPLIGLMFGYAWITGNSAPAVRSAWMAAVFLAAFGFRRRPDLLNALGAVLLVAVCWDGRMLSLVGVQLSYGVVAAIGLWGGWFIRKLSPLAEPDSYLPRCLLTKWQERWYGAKRWVSDSVAISLAAAAGSTPLTAFHFGLVTPIAVLASLVMVPVVFGLLSLGLISAALHPVLPVVSRKVNWVNGWLARSCVQVAEAFASVPGGNLTVPRGERPVLRVYDLEYGAGAVGFQASDGAVLIDCGDRDSFRRVVMPSMRSFGMEPDSVVLSHPDGGHVGGGEMLLRVYSPQQVLLPVNRSRSQSYRFWLDQVGAGKLAGIPAERGKVLPFPDGARLEVVWVPNPEQWDAVADERVCIYRLHWRGWKFLMVNDAGLRTERRMLEAGVDLDADVLIAGHARADLSLGDEMIRAVSPRVIVASNAAHPPEEALNPAQVAYWRSLGIAVFDQRESGGVTIVPDGDELKFSGYVDGKEVRLKR